MAAVAGGEMMLQHQQQQYDANQPQTDAVQPSGPILVDTQHDDMVHDAQLDYYGCKLATSSSDRTVKIYDVSGSNYAHTATIRGHEGPVWEVSWAHPKFGVVLASCSFDGAVLLHRERVAGDWVLVSARRDLFESSANSVAFAPHEYGLVVAAASSDGHVAVLEHAEDDTWTTSKFRDNSLGVNAVSWAPYRDDDDGNTGGSRPRLVTGGCDDRIRFWSRDADGAWTEDDICAATPGGPSHGDWVRDVAWAPSTLSGKDVVASCDEDGKVLIWTTRDDDGDGKMRPTLLNAFDAPVWRLSWSVTGNVLAVSSGDDDVTLWKQTLEGEWRLVSSVDDAAAGNAPQQQPSG